MLCETSKTNNGHETMKVFRIQPIGLELADHRSTTSNENLDRGVHVFHSVDQVASAVNGWSDQGYQPELVTIECEASAVQENGDYEGSVLVGNTGVIVARRSFADWDSLADLCQDDELTA